MKKVIEELIKAAEPFLDGDVVDETSGTVELMTVLKDKIDAAKAMLDEL